MAINTNLNIAPYFDDFDPQKQYVRVLFKPARAVQARELTQLQTILQNQIERFGNNIYQEGTIIEGINPTTETNIRYVKVNDQAGLDNMAQYASTDENPVFVRGLSSGLRAKVLAGANGFQTRDPDLKTLFVKYLVSAPGATVSAAELKYFTKGELLQVEDQNGVEITTMTAASTDDYQGFSYGISVTDGIIYQRGLFNYVEPQLVIVSKYTNIPNDISVGFDITESIIDAGLDESLLDNAQGFNNQNAPGADRLKLTPVLAAYTTATRPAAFFTLVRLEGGQPVYIRGETQFNSIRKEFAKRTSEESGSYVVKGLNVSTEVSSTGQLNAVVGAGTAYAFGYRVDVLNNLRVPIEPVTVTSSKANQATGVTFGSYFEVDVAGQSVVEDFNFTDRYNLWDATGAGGGAGNVIGSCSIRNIENRGSKVRIYVYAVVKNNDGVDYRNIAVSFIGNSSAPTPILNSKIVRANSAAALFDTGRGGMQSAEQVIFVEKKRRLVDNFNTNSPTVALEVQTNGDVTATPLTSNIFGVSTNNEFVPVDTVEPQYTDNNLTQVVVTFDVGSPAKTVEYVYYDASVSGVSQDTLQEVDIWVQTTYNSTSTVNFASLGIPNVVKLKKVLDEDGNDITSKFRLENNQKDGYYDISYLRTKAGEVVANATTLKVNMIAFKRTFLGNSKYLTANSYANIPNLVDYVTPFTGKNGRTYNPINCFDFRPYATPSTQYSQNSANPPVVPSSYTLTLNPTLPIANDKAILSNHTYYLSRIDKLAIDKDQEFVIVKGQPSDNPGKVVNDTYFGIADIYVPGSFVSKQGLNAVRIERNTVKNYTMKDIRGIEKRLDTMVELVSLSLLENETKNMFIPDANGLNRFKNGILVEQFKDVQIADLADSEFKSSIERGQTILAPAITQFPIDLKIDSTSSQNTTTFADVTTKDASQTPQSLVNQEYATTFRNLASNFYRYNGKINMFPRFDAEYDTVTNPAVTFEVDVAGQIRDFEASLGEIIPLVNTHNVGGAFASGAQRRDGDFRVIPMTQNVQDETLTSTLGSQAIELGTYVTDFSMRPFMAAKNIRIMVSGLRPNTTHYFYFDEEPVSQYVQPGGIIAEDITGTSVRPQDVSAIGGLGEAVKTDEYGRLYAVFNIPPSTFYTGDAELLIVDADQFSSIDSAGTSRARDRYRAFNFTMNTTTIGGNVRTIDYDTALGGIYQEDATIRVFDPPPPPQPDDGGGGGGSCFVKGTIVTMANGFKKPIEDVKVGEQLLGQDGSVNTVLAHDFPMLNGREFIGINGSGPFMTPEHPLFTDTGWKAYRMSDTMHYYPHLESIMEGDLKVGDKILKEDGEWYAIESLEVHANEPDQMVYNFILNGNNTYYADGLLAHNRDPLSQTFSVQPAQSDYATFLFVPKIDLWFKQKSPADRRNGITVQIRETSNGYPTSRLVSFASKHVDWSEIVVSDDASLATTVTFDNPVKLEVGRDYCIVIEPDAIDPDYFIWTAKVGENDIADNSVQVTSDWGYGVLFTSTDNKAWQSYQNEDIKFKLYKQPFSTEPSHVDLIPNDMEFFTISDNTLRFQNDEYAYVETVNVYDGTFLSSGKIATPLGGDFTISTGDMVVIKQQDTVHVSTVKRLIDDGANKILTLTDTPVVGEGTVTITAAIGGKVAYFNSAKPDRLHLKASTSRSGLEYTLDGNQTIRGATSGATARLQSLFDAPVSYFQPFVMAENTMRTSTGLVLFKQTGAVDDAENNSGDSIGFYSSNYMTGTPRYIPSKQNILNNPTDIDRFRFRMSMDNGGYRFVTPVIDNELSTMQVYEYRIGDSEANTSKYISKKVVLQPDYPAEGLRVVLAAYRPAGTVIDVFARFTYPDDPDSISDWVLLTNQSLNLYSTTANITDYRDFDYVLDTEKEYDAFQIKIVLRHATDDELNDADLFDIVRAENLYPHVYDYRAIALT